MAPKAAGIGYGAAVVAEATPQRSDAAALTALRELSVRASGDEISSIPLESHTVFT